MSIARIKTVILLLLQLHLGSQTIVIPDKKEGIKKISVIDSLELVLQKTGEDTNRVINLNKLSFRYLLAANNEKAMLYAQKSGELSIKLGYQKGLIKSAINSGNAWQRRGDDEKAKQQFLRAYDLAKKEKNQLLIEHSTNNLGELYRRQNNYEKALFYFFEALKV